MILDTHVHFWEFDPVRDAWIDDSMRSLQRDFSPADWRQAIRGLGVSGCMAVQADQSEAETEYLIGLAEVHPEIKGVIGWLDLRRADLPGRLDYFSQHSRLKGLRHVVQAEASGFMLQSDFQKGIAQLANRNLIYEILIYAPQLAEALELVRAFPNQRFILDHLGKPNIRHGGFDPWSRDLAALAAQDNCSCKLSGMVTEADWHTVTTADLEPYAQHALECFGPGRLLYGSDWPVCRLAAPYPEVVSMARELMAGLSATEQKRIFYDNAVSFYNLS